MSVRVIVLRFETEHECFVINDTALSGRSCLDDNITFSQISKNLMCLC